MFVRDPNKTPDSSQRPPHNCLKCGNPVDGLYCRQCALLRKKLKEVWFTICEENENFQDFLNTSKSFNDNTNVVNAPQEPFIFNQDPDDIFCHQCTCESCGNGAHYGYNCSPKVSIISNLEPCHNQNVDEFSQTLPSFLRTCYSGDENSFAYDSTPNFVDDSPNDSTPQPPKDSYEFCKSDAHYSHDCPPKELAEYINTPCWNRPAFYKYDNDDDEDYTIAITPVLSTEEPVDSLIMEDEHLDTIPATELDDDFFDFNDDSTSIDDDYFSIDDIDYFEASPPDSELVSLEEVKDDILREKLLNIHLLINKIESDPTPDHVLKSLSLFAIPVKDNDSFFEKSDTSLSYSDNSLPEFKALAIIRKKRGELTSVVMEYNLGKPRVYVPNVLPTHPTLMLDLDFIPFDKSLPKSEIFCFDIEEKNSGSMVMYINKGTKSKQNRAQNGKRGKVKRNKV
uniref:Uncharacterized protein n=1 Tax=Tanacetum cinerariifolium TaxID=118510 RepID=A0A6L2MB41_TANCI|nr:hypothetical protein [Tanacetum cinerariifolium]